VFGYHIYAVDILWDFEMVILASMPNPSAGHKLQGKMDQTVYAYNLSWRLIFFKSCFSLLFVSDRKSKESSFESDYIVGSLLGSGGFGTVYSGVRRQDGSQVI
jgi:hypothetical protein